MITHNKIVSVNYYLRNIAEKDPDTGRILTGYGRKALEQAIIRGRVKTDEQGRIYLNTLKNL
jgi:protocatechuate 3,4-dioxygenase beta subunit